MNNKKIIKVLGSAALAATIGITGCSVKAAEETTEKTSKETTRETTEETEDEDYCGSGCYIDEDDEEYYSSYSFQSTNGELEGQDEYMELCPTHVDNSYDEIGDDYYINDLTVIEDEDVRALAQSYMDDGFRICDPRVDLAQGWAMGDGEYMFNNGFSAEYDDGEWYKVVYAYKMNETLFNYFFVELYPWDADAVTEDDGTVIRVSEEGFYVEFNRDTGIGIYYYDFQCDPSLGDEIEVDI
ncbi:hypothetical protein SAMN06296952_2671 [Oscillospiraceae bacterium]|nr:hypothetical protein SAMN06296952_2671 [Oscillospiraceae bacterium]